jgi:phosphatidylglycerophosphatase A
MNGLPRRAILFFVTGAGAGYVPKLPGTAGTLLAIPFSLALNSFAVDHLLPAILFLIGAILCAIWLSNLGAAILRQQDPPPIVIDEIVGFLIANFLAPPRISALVWSFVLFRFFDIAKVYPCNRLEKLAGGAGIVLDDVAAGLYAFLGAQLLLKLGWG